MSDAQFLSNITHLILDEVHEKQEEIDFLFVYIKHFLRVGLKIIFMSATIDSGKRETYFHCPSLTVPGRVHQTNICVVVNCYCLIS